MITVDEVKNLHMEISTYCNAACPNCPRNYASAYTNPLLNLEHLSLENVKKLHDIFLKIDRINMCGNFGDAIMSPHLIDIIEYIVSVNNKIQILIRTNGGVRNKSFWKKLGQISKDTNQVIVIFSIDGLIDTNHIYRRNVDWNKLTNNITTYIPNGGIAHWEFLQFEHNQHQIQEAEELSKGWGFEKFIKKIPLGFENYGNGVGEIPVLDSKSNLLYMVRQSSEHITYYNNNDPVRDIPKITKQRFDEYYQTASIRDSRSIVIPKDVDDVKCNALRDKEIYVSANGDVLPCCFLGITSGKILSKDVFEFNKWLIDNDYKEKINLQNRTITEILNDKIFSEIQKLWHTKEQAALRCINICGVCGTNQKNTVDKIFNE
tara:strand:+ start:6943 stop:8070 length:1128 start_codon:yes stop_codon:yes gene_type:complete